MNIFKRLLIMSLLNGYKIAFLMLVATALLAYIGSLWWILSALVMVNYAAGRYLLSGFNVQ